jgi:CheY-like chemotaxis protein
MEKQYPLIIIEDDTDDQEILKAAMKELGVKNELIFFSFANDAYDFLLTTTTQPFLIITDINLPGINGLEFEKKIFENEYLRKKSIPFIFLTTTDAPKVIAAVYDYPVQGFFKKPSDYKILVEHLNSIINYWCICKHPNSTKLIR